MEIKLPWLSASQPPELQVPSYEFETPESEPVLAVSKSGHRAVCIYSKEVGEPGKWRTDDSEGWDVTDDLVAWTPLPTWPA